MKKKWIITIDFFQCMLRGKLPAEQPDRIDMGEGVSWVKNKMASRQFECAYEIFVRGKSLAIAFAYPRNGNIISPGTIQLKINNEQLYTKSWMADFNYLCKVGNLRMMNVSRLDIALDGHGHLDFYRRYMQGEMLKLGRASTVEYFEGKRRLTGVDIGSKSSDKCVTIYNKSRELQKVNKTYIQDWWERNGIDTSRDVERLEIKLKNTEIKRYKWWNPETDEMEEFNIRHLHKVEYLASILRTGLSRFYEFVEVSDDKNVSRKKKVSYIDWKKISAVYLYKEQVRKSNEVYRVKLSCKTLFFTYLATNSDIYRELAWKMAMGINALKWIADKEQFWIREYVKHREKGTFEYMPEWKRLMPGDQLSFYTDSVTFDN